MNCIGYLIFYYNVTIDYIGSSYVTSSTEKFKMIDYANVLNQSGPLCR